MENLLTFPPHIPASLPMVCFMSVLIDDWLNAILRQRLAVAIGVELPHFVFGDSFVTQPARAVQKSAVSGEQFLTAAANPGLVYLTNAWTADVQGSGLDLWA